MRYGKKYISYKIFFRVLIVFFFVLKAYSSIGQTEYVVINKILIDGNKKTNSQVIFNEINIFPGDTIDLSSLSSKLSQNAQRLQSIGLFTQANINIKNWNTETSQADLEIKVQEAWFIYPYLIFELADRNFNVWRKEFNYSFKRVNYGLALNHINLTGNMDKLKLKFQHGFTRKYELSYNFPYVINKWGLSTNLIYKENRELGYATVGNRLIFHKEADERKLFSQHRASLTLHHRPSALMFQKIQLEYVNAKIDASVTDLNPNFFLNGSSNLNYFLLDYEFKFDNTRYPIYPLDGFRLDLNARKEGFGGSTIDNTFMSISMEKHTPLIKNIIFSTRLKVKLNLQNNKIPYFNYQALGYKSDVMTGYQLYVLDGKDFLLFKSALKFKLLDSNIQFDEFIPIQFRTMNAKLFARLNFDFGYARDPFYKTSNPYSNRSEYGYGPALDLIIYNNFTLSCELGITRFGEKGFFFESGFIF